ncbi:hypothetical protein VP1G_04189 [Cytospora mali]|uniref:PAS domain-containing protein n=1 Tax=Cytospora mali TaxID=578113 RepID=A0A194UYQ9_CYTMA|nr:hypothetical protein VP1G_04189 [Valsa mali var. pyri (nom. inval.)]
MEHTFMTIHNLTPDCNILFVSDSITDILGWRTEEVHGRSVFDYFHPDEVPFARSVHSRGILLDKAASLHYARIVSRDGRWVSCECCFTVVHDVLVACTSIYRRGEKSERRAIEGAQIRRIFSSSPRDPRYHMLEHLSPKFRMPPVEREPRAALILNRFTRNLSIMFATNAVASVLGLSPDQVKDKSFYRCIQERCLPDALKCLESAKANDSIAYLRFWSRDPRGEGYSEDEESDEDESMVERERQHGASDSEDGGAELGDGMNMDPDDITAREIKREYDDDEPMDFLPSAGGIPGQSSSGNAASSPRSRNHYPQPSVLSDGGLDGRRLPRGRHARHPVPSVELEAVVSCTSDGLVVVLRRARPQIPPAHPPLVLPPWESENGLFAAPWAQQPVRPAVPPEMLYTFRPPLLPQFMPLQEGVKAAGGPPMEQLMRSIRDVAVFAWALCGINGNLSAFSHGRPAGEAAPPDGLPIWDPTAVGTGYQPPENRAAAKWAAMAGNTNDRVVQQPQSPVPPYYSPQYGQDTNYVHSMTGYPAQQGFYGAGYASMPQHYQQQQQAPLHSTAAHRNFSHPPQHGMSEPQSGSSGPFADPSTRSSGQVHPPHHFTRGQH